MRNIPDDGTLLLIVLGIGMGLGCLIRVLMQT
jgi:hypothetical protein